MARRTCGLVLNPANGQPGDVMFDENDGEVAVFTLDGDVIARGALDVGQHGEKHQRAARLSGFPRVHTTPGVLTAFRKEKGWGTVLYTGACLASHLVWTETFSVRRLIGDRDGVSSDTDMRSNAADRWWERAKSQYGLVVSEEMCGGEEERTANISRSSASSQTRRAVKEILSDAIDDTILDVTEWDLSVSYTAEECIVVDVYPFENAEKAGLILAQGNAVIDENAFFEVNDDTLAANYGEVNLDGMRALNVGYLAAWSDRSQAFAAMDRLVKLMQSAGGTREDVDAMVTRFNAGVDPGAPQYTASAVASPNPSTVCLRRTFGNGRTLLVRARLPSARYVRSFAPPSIVTYAARRARGRRGRSALRNGVPTLPASVQDALRRTYDARIALGWGAFRDAL